MPTPNIYTGPAGFSDRSIPPVLRSSTVDMLYITDRSVQKSELKRVRYDASRSSSSAFGSVAVEIGKHLPWQQLINLSQMRDRTIEPELRVRSVKEITRFPATPHSFSMQNGRFVDNPDVMQDFATARERFYRELRQRLRVSAQKEVLVFVHGFNDSFEESATSLAELWHFTGRRGVPILYSWPADIGGLFGYFIARESGEFTIYHFKEFMRLLSAMPEIEHINIIAHSRGADITTTAMRELIIETRAKGKNPVTVFKIKNLILAAPDLDLDIVRQRLMAEKFGPAFGQITIYTNSADTALNLSEFLMSGTRFGRMKAADLKPSDQEFFSRVPNVNIIDVGATQSMFGHSYFLNHPATSSDILLILRDGQPPGSISRPLRHKFLNFWEMPKAYLKPKIKESERIKPR